MDKLEAAFGHLGNLSEEELRARVRQVRKDRRIAKVSKTVKKAAKAKSDTARTKVKKTADALNDKDLVLRMLKEMGVNVED